MTATPMPTSPARRLISQPMIEHDLRQLGVAAGMTLLVHSSLKSIGWVNGGAAAVILALEAVLGSNGTLVMPTHTGDQSDPAMWRHPPVPEAWWQPIRETMPLFERSLTPAYGMGAIPETFRKQTGVVRSDHPSVSFAAWGKDAHFVVDDHAFVPSLGDGSPLARIYDLHGAVLLLGVDHDHNTSLHLAEARAQIPKRMARGGAPLLVGGVREWVTFEDIDWDESSFEQIGADYARTTSNQRTGNIGDAKAVLVPQRPLVDFAVSWLERAHVTPST